MPGPANAAPPTNKMNSRRLIAPLDARGKYLTGSGRALEGPVTEPSGQGCFLSLPALLLPPLRASDRTERSGMLLELAGTFVATFVARADRLETIARLHALHAVALNVLVGLNGPVGLDRLARLNRLVVLDVDGLARLDSLDVFAALDSLHALNALRTFAELRAGLRP